MPDTIDFKSGADYDRYMGIWSRLVGHIFLEWLHLRPGMRWLDVGCGSGAFTEIIVERCAPGMMGGIDPSEEQLAFARTRPPLKVVEFRQANAQAVPFQDNAFDVAVMPLVISFVPDPAKGVGEMARVVCPEGTIAAYIWDMFGGGFPYEALQGEMRAMGVSVPVPPSNGVAKIGALRDLWIGAGLINVETREIDVKRTFANFNDYWTTILGGPSVGPGLAAMGSKDLGDLKARMRARMTSDGAGQITLSARAIAVKGKRPKLSLKKT